MPSWVELFSWGDRGWGDELVAGVLMTLALAVPSFLAGCAIGTAGASALESRRHPFVAALVKAYTTVGRGVPELLVVYLVFFGGGQAVQRFLELFGDAGETHLSPYLAGLIALSLIAGAYSTEVMRGAYKALDRGQAEAARAFGWSRPAAFARIIFPQLMRIAMPALGNVWLATLKDTALISVTGLVELMRSANVAAGSTRLPLHFYAAAMLLYLLLTAASGRFFERIERHLNRGWRPSVNA